MYRRSYVCRQEADWKEVLPGCRKGGVFGIPSGGGSSVFGSGAVFGSSTAGAGSGPGGGFGAYAKGGAHGFGVPAAKKARAGSPETDGGGGVGEGEEEVRGAQECEINVST